MDIKHSGEHGYYGAWDPLGGCRAHNKTFSIGIFQWIPTSDYTRCKKGPVKVRVNGPVSKAKEINAKASEIADQLNNGTYSGPKNVTVK